MDSKFKSTEYSIKWLLSIYILIFVLTLIFTLNFKITKKRLPVYLCFPFIDPTKSEKILNVVTILLSVGHFGTFILTIILYFILVKKVKETQKNIRKSKSDESNVFLIIQIAILSVSNFICWIPADIICIATMFMPKYPLRLIMFIIFLFIPINSLIYPTLFGLLAVRKIFKRKESTKEHFLQ